MTLTEIESAIRDYIIGELERASDAELRADTPLLQNDLLDSVGVYEVVVYLEERYSIEIIDEEVVPENFGTISALAKLVASKR